MALGTSYRSDQKRNDIIRRALRDCKVIKPGEAVDGNLMREGVDSLNAILREEDQDQTGQKRFLTALKTGHLILEVGRTIYTAAEGLADDIQELHSVIYRDSLGGETPLDFISPKQYEALTPKTDTGDPRCVWLKLAQDVADNSLYVWPITRTAGTTSVVLGTDGADYQCILKHTSSTDRKPITGSDYSTYWQPLTTTAGSAWADETEYSNGALIRYLYKRPLFNFDSIDDDPDVPDGWANYLRWRLAIDMAASHDVKDSDREWFERRLAICLNALFPSNQAKTSDYHNRTLFF